MKLKNRLYEKPKLHQLVLERAQKNYVIPREYGGTYFDDEVVYDAERGHYIIGLPVYSRNVESCINKWVDHLILTYMLEHPKEEYIDTDDCQVSGSENWDVMRKIILNGEQSPEYRIRSLKYVDDMIELVNFILRTLNL